jgi:hypothetical protein
MFQQRSGKGSGKLVGGRNALLNSARYADGFKGPMD